MTRQQMRQFIEGLIHDNSKGEITAKVLRDAMLGIYDTAILNAAGSGGVSLPIGTNDVEDVAGFNLEDVLRAIKKNVESNRVALIPFTYDPTGNPLKLIIAAEMECLDKMEVGGDSPEFVLRHSVVGGEGKIRWVDNKNVNRASILYDEQLEALAIKNDKTTLILDKRGNIEQLIETAPTKPSHLANMKYVKDALQTHINTKGIIKLSTSVDTNTAVTPNTEAVLQAFDTVEFDNNNGHMVKKNGAVEIKDDGLFRVTYDGRVESNNNVSFSIYLSDGANRQTPIIYQDGKGVDKGIGIRGETVLNLKAGDVLSLKTIAKNNSTVIAKEFTIIVEKI